MFQLQKVALATFYDKSKREVIIPDIKYNIKNEVGKYKDIYNDKILFHANNPKLGKLEDWSIATK
jgi:hypothetical protein